MAEGRPGGPTVGAVLALLLWGLGSCGGESAIAPADGVELEAIALYGDGQFAEPGSSLPVPLEVLVRRTDGQELEEALRVVWETVQGEGASLGRTDGFTDASQRARTVLTLGPGLGPYRIRAVFPGVELEPVEFSARAVTRPVLTGISPDPVAPGDVVELTGTGLFVPELEGIDVLFSGVRARVVDGETARLRVRVPSCLNEPRVQVRVGLGSLRSDPIPLDVEGPGDPLSMDPSGILVVRDSAALSCRLLPGSPDARYLAVVHSTARAGYLAHDFSVVLRDPGGAVAAPASSPGDEITVEEGAPLAEGSSLGAGDAASAERPRPPAGAARTAQHRWDLHLRTLEARAVELGSGIPEARRPAGAPPPPIRVPEPGDRRSFEVLNGEGGFDRVEAEVRHVGDRVVVYVDLDAPPGGFEPGDPTRLGREFDDPVYATVGDAFGEVSDLDGNGRVAVLFTPTVNRLTEAGSDGFIGGFFYGLDLLPDRPGSNAAEIFYAVVPDPDGEEGEPRTRAEVLFNVPAVLAHELQHMIHFNERVLKRRAERADALWLSEALAHTAEELVARSYRSLSDPASALKFDHGNFERARHFLRDPAGTSLVGDGSLDLATRGAGWLFLKHVRGENPGGDSGDWLLAELTRTTRTGIGNVSEALGERWADLVEPWTVALYLDGLGLDVDSRYLFRGIDLRGELASTGSGYPLQPDVHGGTDRTVEGRVYSSTGRHLLVEPGPEGLALNLAGPDGGALPPRSGLALTLVRLQ